MIPHGDRMTRLSRLALVAALPATLMLQGCLTMAVGGAVVGTAGKVAVGTARVGTHVVAEGVRLAVPGESRAERRERLRREREEREMAERERREAERRR